VGIPFLLGPGLGANSARPMGWWSLGRTRPYTGHERNEQTTTRRATIYAYATNPVFPTSGYLAGVEALRAGSTRPRPADAV